MSLKTSIDYLVVGHITRDLIPTGDKPGGTVTFSGRLAAALGCQTAVLTSARADYPYWSMLENCHIEVVPSETDTIFENIYRGNQRVQRLHAVAERITAQAVPQAWRAAKIVHLGPLTNEIDPEIVDLFPDSLIGLTPQGWMRRWGADGMVYAQRFAEAERMFGQATAVVISEEDLLDDAMLDDYIRWSKILVMTENYAGCTVFVNQQGHVTRRRIPAPQIDLVEPTGAGDIFAAAFFIQLSNHPDDPFEAARFANHVAAYSVTQTALDEKVQAWKKYPPI